MLFTFKWHQINRFKQCYCKGFVLIYAKILRINIITMSTIEFLINRQSNGFLIEPAPSNSQLDNILNAAVAVPDHGGLNPYQFKIISGDGLKRLTDIFVKAMSSKHNDAIKIEKANKMAYRAPMIIVIASKFQNHPKIPKQEQLITVGCAAHAMQMAAVAQGLGSMWRTGDLAYDPIVKNGLGIDQTDEIVGFLYVGTINKQLKSKPRKSPLDFVEIW